MAKPTIRKPTAAEKKEAASWPIWEKEPSTFPYSYQEKETCLILEGKALVRTDEGEFAFAAGDFVVFPAGLRCTWVIKERIKKHYRFG
ncbi:MAG: cupin domain-containing protein [Nanoarchaeota archaeon]